MATLFAQQDNDSCADADDWTFQDVTIVDFTHKLRLTPSTEVRYSVIKFGVDQSSWQNS